MRAAIEDALSLLVAYAPGGPAALHALPDQRLPSLLAECEAICATLSGPEPVRMIHHLACTGGTLISKSVAALPNVVLVSEIDPLSRMQVRPGKPAFAPTDLILGLRSALRPVPDTALIEMFAASVATLRDRLSAQGQVLVLRDHSHSCFCTSVDASLRPTLREMVASLMPTRSVITVRHPLDSFLALHANNWRHFEPFTLEEYARRVLGFLNRHDDVALVRYEDFVLQPDEGLATIAGHLGLAFDAGAFDVMTILAMSGDSGRRSEDIGLRPRRQVPAEIAAQRQTATSYAALCARLDYDDI
jgi:hypothetical protein